MYTGMGVCISVHIYMPIHMCIFCPWYRYVGPVTNLSKFHMPLSEHPLQKILQRICNVHKCFDYLVTQLCPIYSAQYVCIPLRIMLVEGQDYAVTTTL